ncbi:DNA polymerase III subunit delta [Candidatus Margulisiibacteriota bacterium]
MKQSIYFIYGEEGFSVEEEAKRLIGQDPSLEKEKYYESFSMSKLFDTTAMLSLFAQNKIFILKNPYFLFKAISDDEIELFKKVCQQIVANEHKMIIYVIEKKVDMRKKIAAFLKKNVNISEFNSFKAWEQDKVISWLNDYVRAKGKQIEQKALFALEETAGNNLRQLAQEVDKLLVYLGERENISFEDVKTVSMGTSINIFDLLESLQQKNTKKIVSNIQDLLKSGEDPIKTFGFIASNIRLFYQILYLSNARKSFQEIAKATGKNPFYIKRLETTLIKNYNLLVLKDTIINLAKLDMEIKSGKIKPEIALFLAFNKFN